MSLDNEKEYLFEKDFHFHSLLDERRRSEVGFRLDNGHAISSWEASATPFNRKLIITEAYFNLLQNIRVSVSLPTKIEKP